MSSGRDEGPVYYREIQKNAYLKRIPNETSNKLIPLGHKKPPLKPMWTLFCVHNGRTPFLEQYPAPESDATLSHRPVWRASLRSARHVTCGVSPRRGEYDFLVDTENGPVRMLAPDWESMQDWVTTLRTKLHELKIVPRGENVYCPAPAAPPPRAAARDPTSPLPPTPPVPPHRVPGIELTTPATRQPQITQPEQPTTTQPEQSEPDTQPNPTTETEPEIDISNWEPDTNPTTSQELETTTKTSVAKICGQNICLDDSILKRSLSNPNTESDEEFFAEIDRISESVENLSVSDISVGNKDDFKQRLVVSDVKEAGQTSAMDSQSDRPSNITVIQVSNKPPHTAIPVMGPETNVFNFDFKQNVPVTTDSQNDSDSFVNIVNTEVNVNSENGYGTVFTKEPEYGHISLTTTVSLTGDVKTDRTDNEGIYEKLCLASTSNDNKSPILTKKIDKIRNIDKVRKSSLPNLDTSDNTYEYLFPNNNKNTTVTLNTEPTSLVIPREVNSNLTITNNSSNQRNLTRTNEVRTDSVPNVTNINTSERASENRVVQMVASTVTVNQDNRAVVERSHSQNSYDRVPRRVGRRVQNNSPKREAKHEKTECQPKPIWKRGLTELSLLSKLRGLSKRAVSPVNHTDSDRAVVKVQARSRPAARHDAARRRSSSLSNEPPPAPAVSLTPLRARQAALLRAEQRLGAATPATVPTRHPPAFLDYNGAVWIAHWGGAGPASGGRAGDKLVAIRGLHVPDAAAARHILANTHAPQVTILFQRVPLGKMYVIYKRDLQPVGLTVAANGVISGSAPGSPAARLGLPPPGHWALTEANARPLLHAQNVQEELSRVTLHGAEASVLLQPAALVKKLRATKPPTSHR